MILPKRALSRLFSLWLAVGSLSPMLAEGAEIQVEGKVISPGHSKIEVLFDRKPAASFIYGAEELKPYLNVYAPDGKLVTEWSASQPFPHHRGIYIGWNRITSDLGRFDLWHLNGGGEMKVRSVSTGTSSDKQHGDRAIIEAVIEWKGKRNGASESELLLTEWRKMVIHPKPEGTQVDVTFRLTAAHDLTLGGDLQHSGIHFRASHTVAEREKETSYLWEPPVAGPGGKAKSSEFKWVRFLFPIEDHWYSAMELNHPENPVEELSWRSYGRFGFFFSRELKKDQKLELKYRFLVSPVEKPMSEKHSTEEIASFKGPSDELYQKFVTEIPAQTKE